MPLCFPCTWGEPRFCCSASETGRFPHVRGDDRTNAGLLCSACVPCTWDEPDHEQRRGRSSAFPCSGA